MGFFGVLISGSLSAAILTYYLGGSLEFFFSMALVMCVLTEVIFNTKKESE